MGGTPPESSEPNPREIIEAISGWHRAEDAIKALQTTMTTSFQQLQAQFSQIAHLYVTKPELESVKNDVNVLFERQREHDRALPELEIRMGTKLTALGIQEAASKATVRWLDRIVWAAVGGLIAGAVAAGLHYLH